MSESNGSSNGSQGGGGELFGRPDNTRSDARMIEMAIRKRWPIKPEYCDAVVKKLVSVVANRNTSDRELIAASKALIAAERQNQIDEHVALPRKHELSGPDGGPIELSNATDEQIDALNSLVDANRKAIFNGHSGD